MNLLFFSRFTDSGHLHCNCRAVCGDQGKMEVVDIDLHGLFHRLLGGCPVPFAREYTT